MNLALIRHPLFRALATLPLIAGYFIVPASLRTSEFLILNSVGVAACLILVIALRGAVIRYAWAWAILILFLVGHFLKTYWFLGDYQYWKWEASYSNSLQRLLSPDLVLEGFRYTIIAFVSFCMFLALLVFYETRKPLVVQRAFKPHAKTVFACGVICIVIAIAALAAGLVRARYSIGVLGLEDSSSAEVLPFRLGTALVRFHANILPSVSLLILWISWMSESNWLKRIAILTGLFSAATISVSSTTRGTIVLYLLQLFALRAASRKLRWMDLVYGTIGCLAFSILFPFLAEMRAARVAGERDFLATISYALDARLNNPSSTQSAKATLAAFAFRVIGADGVWCCLPNMADGEWGSTLGAKLLNPGEYYTREVILEQHEATHFSPGVVAVGMLAGNFLGVVFLLLVLVVASHLLWNWALRQPTRPVAATVVGFSIFGFWQEGTFNFKDLIAAVISILICNWILRTLITSKRLGRAGISGTNGPSNTQPVVATRLGAREQCSD